MSIYLKKSQNLLKVLEEQTKSNWLVNYNNYSLLEHTQKLIKQLKQFQDTYGIKPVVLLLEPEPIKFIASFCATIITKVPVFLGNSHWQNSELQQIQKLLQPDLIWGKENYITPPFVAKTSKFLQPTVIGIPTGGSSGKIRFALHTTETLSASVKGFANYFAVTQINSCCTLPLYHVSGLMQLWRSLLTRGKLAIVPYRDLKQGIKPQINPEDYFLSLVPTQLQLLLETDAQWLAQFKTILLGGAPSSRSLVIKARQQQIPISTTYGMTETASGISYLQPSDFLQGNYSSGKILPHARVDIIDSQHNTLEANRIGKIKITAESLAWGYHPPNTEINKSYVTDDLGFIDTQGFLHIVGRESQKIITGGENVYPAEIEAAILATQLVKDVCVIGLEDPKWGQVVTALFIPVTEKTETTSIQQQIQSQLSKYKQPKYWFPLPSLPRDNKGKVNYTQLKKIAQKILAQKKQM